MDYTPMIHEGLKVLWWLLPAMLIVGFFKSAWFKGMLGETLVKLATKLRLPSDTYHAIHDVTLPTPDGTTQIDHIFVSRFGIFVVETKNMKGWIFGDEYQPQWTQQLFRKSFKFQNPLRQNYKHTRTLQTMLGVPDEVIHSVVVFTGENTFKTRMPANVTKSGAFIKYIKSFREPILLEIEVEEIIYQIETGRLNPSWKTSRQHVRNLKNRSSSTTVKTCPRCGSIMVLRTAKQGANAGSQFWGCSGYPRCRAVENFRR